MIIELRPYEIKKIVSQIRSHYGIKLNQHWIYRVFSGNPSLFESFCEYGFDDTFVRENFIACFIRSLGMEQEWPTFSEDEEVRAQFNENLKTVAKKYSAKIEKGEIVFP